MLPYFERYACKVDSQLFGSQHFSQLFHSTYKYSKQPEKSWEFLGTQIWPALESAVWHASWENLGIPNSSQALHDKKPNKLRTFGNFWDSRIVTLEPMARLGKFLGRLWET